MEKAVDEDKKVPGVTTAPPILSSFPLGFFGKLFWRRDGEVREQMPCNFYCWVYLIIDDLLVVFLQHELICINS